MRALVVDADARLRELLATALRYQGFSARTAANGREAAALDDAFGPEAGGDSTALCRQFGRNRLTVPFQSPASGGVTCMSATSPAAGSTSTISMRAVDPG